MVRGEAIRALVDAARRERNRAVVAMTSATVFAGVSVLWLCSTDYTTPMFTFAGVITAFVIAVLLAIIWIFTGAQLDLEERRAKTTRRRR